MRILALEAENFKRISVVSIKPDGNLVQITGKNGQGKTSVLDAIWSALDNASHTHAVPIRRGAKEARIRVDLGDDGATEMIVTRTFKNDEEGKTTTRLTVTNPQGFKAPTPQKMIDGLLASLSFEPIEFMRQKPKDQLVEMRAFVPGVDFDADDAAHTKDYDARRDANREADRCRAAAASIVVPEGLPGEQVDVAALMVELERITTHNGNVEQRRANRERAQETITANDGRIAQIEAALVQQTNAATQRCGGRRANINAQIAALQQELDGLDGHLEQEIAGLAAQSDESQRPLHTQNSELRERLAAAGDLPAIEDPSPLREQISQATTTNAGITKRTERERYEKEAAGHEERSAALTKAMEARAAAQRKAISEAKMPVEGLSLSDTDVLLNGLPLSQASGAEQLRVSMSVAMASDSRLRVCRIRDGSLLDTDGLALVAKMAEEANCQVWLERVDTSGSVGFVMEDGRLAGAEPKLL